MLQEDSFLEDNEDCWDQHILELPVPTKEECKDIGLRDTTASGESPPAGATPGYLGQAKGVRPSDPCGSALSAGPGRTGPSLTCPADRSRQAGSDGVWRKCCLSAKADNRANVVCAMCSAEFCDADCFLLHSQICKECAAEN